MYVLHKQWLCISFFRFQAYIFNDFACISINRNPNQIKYCVCEIGDERMAKSWMAFEL